MTQRLTHLLSHTNTHRETHTAAFTCCTEGGLRSTETMCSDPARLIRCTSSTLPQPPQRLPRSSPHPGYVCPPICVSSNHSSPPPFTLPFFYFHIPQAKEITFFVPLFLKSFTYSTSADYRVVKVFPHLSSLPVRTVSGGSSLSPGMKLTVRVSADLSHPSSHPLPSPAD